ncbi:MAG: hypothetical protein JSU85_01640 [Candidatus Zixiibacteriota bacterium]|nr:MAG: hypothetical protein JSU85_01640 [candidate division Zixibacteria bacterium]
MWIKEKFEEHPVVYIIVALAIAIGFIEGLRLAIFPEYAMYLKDKYEDCQSQNRARRDSIRILADSLSSLTAFFEYTQVEEYDTLIASYNLAVGDSIMPFNSLSKIKIMRVALDEFKNQDTIGLIINFVFYTYSRFIDAEYIDSVRSGYSLYNRTLAKNESFPFHLGSGKSYKCKLTDISNSNGKTLGTLEFYKIIRKKKS